MKNLFLASKTSKYLSSVAGSYAITIKDDSLLQLADIKLRKALEYASVDAFKWHFVLEEDQGGETWIFSIHASSGIQAFDRAIKLLFNGLSVKEVE